MTEAPRNDTARNKRSWLNRLLELGNHNKIIAVATLVTLATGIPFLVMSAVTALTGSKSATPEELYAAAVIVMQEQFDSTGAAASSGTVEIGKEGLRTLDRESRNPEATAQEQRKYAQALIAFGDGDERDALTMLASIAKEQEKRGANEAAAAIWCQRATLQLYSDIEEASKNYERAQYLSDSGIDPYSQIERARLLRLQMRNEECVLSLRKAVRKAQEIGDFNAKGLALLALAQRPQIDDQEGHVDFVTAFELFRRQTQQDPSNLELVQSLALAGMLGGAGGRQRGTWLLEGVLVPNPDTASLLAELQQELARISALDGGEDAPVAERAALALLHTAVGHLHNARGDIELAGANFEAAQALALSVVADKTAKPMLLRSMSQCFFPAVVFSTRIEDKAGAQRMALAYLECCRRIFAADIKNPGAMRILSLSLVFAGRYSIKNDDVEGGVALLDESIEFMWAAYNGILSPVDHATMALILLNRCIDALPDSDGEQAMAWAKDGRRAWEEISEQRRSTGISAEAVQLQLNRDFPHLSECMQKLSEPLKSAPPTDEG